MGHPESGDIQGLTAAYFIQTMEDYRTGVRKDPIRMTAIAKATSPEDVREAAAWFASLKPVPRWSIVEERAMVPKTFLGQGRMRHIDKDAPGTEPIGNRIITVPEDPLKLPARLGSALTGPMVPQSGRLTTLLGLGPEDGLATGDRVQRLSNPWVNYVTYVYNASTGWSRTTPTPTVFLEPQPAYGAPRPHTVVHKLAKAFNERGVPALRFNFRGVGARAVRYDEGEGETPDALAAIDWALQRWPGAGLCCFVAMTLCGAAEAQAPFPIKPVRVIVASGPAGAIDAIARVMATKLSDVLGQPVAGVELGLRASNGSRGDPDDTISSSTFGSLLWTEELSRAGAPLAISGGDGRYTLRCPPEYYGCVVARDERWESVLVPTARTRTGYQLSRPRP